MNLSLIIFHINLDKTLNFTNNNLQKNIPTNNQMRNQLDEVDNQQKQ